MFSTKSFEEIPADIIDKFVLPLMDSKDVNLLEYKDYKDNNALHLFCKGKMNDIHNFLSEKIYEYMPVDMP